MVTAVGRGGGEKRGAGQLYILVLSASAILHPHASAQHFLGLSGDFWLLVALGHIFHAHPLLFLSYQGLWSLELQWGRGFAKKTK